MNDLSIHQTRVPKIFSFPNSGLTELNKGLRKQISRENNALLTDKKSSLRYQTIDLKKPVVLNFNTIKKISVECVEMVDKTTETLSKALLLSVRCSENTESCFLIEIENLLSAMRLNENDLQIQNRINYESLFHSLSPREQRVLNEVSKGFTSSEISQTLYISTNTVKNHRKNIKKKLSFDDNQEYSKFLKWSLEYCGNS